MASTANVVRRVIVEDVVYGIGSRAGQTDFYICDNDIRGRLDWPWVFDATAGEQPARRLGHLEERQRQ